MELETSQTLFLELTEDEAKEIRAFLMACVDQEIDLPYSVNELLKLLKGAMY